MNSMMTRSNVVLSRASVILCAFGFGACSESPEDDAASTGVGASSTDVSGGTTDSTSAGAGSTSTGTGSSSGSSAGAGSGQPTATGTGAATTSTPSGTGTTGTDDGANTDDATSTDDANDPMGAGGSGGTDDATSDDATSDDATSDDATSDDTTPDDATSDDSATDEQAGGAGGEPDLGGGGAGGAGDDPGAGGSGGEPTTDDGTTDPPSGEACPADATFCSGFDSDELPEGAVFKLNGDPATPWTALFEVDSSVQFAGAGSLRVRKNAEPNASTMYKMLAVPSGGSSFWVRMYLRSDVELGQEGHNAYAAASASDDPNDGSRVEFADDVGLSFNAADDVRWPEGYGRLTSGGTNPYTLAANEWHCIELFFDGTGRTQSLFIEGEEVLVASDYPSSAMTFGVFKFGYQGFHNESDRGVWYDEIAVGPTRIGCLAP